MSADATLAALTGHRTQAGAHHRHTNTGHCSGGATASEDAHGARIRAPSVGSLTPTTSVQFTESELTSPDSKLNKLEGHVITESYSSSWEALVRRQGSL